MTQTTARIRHGGKHFEVLVDMDKALEFRKTGSPKDFLEIDTVFLDSKKGMHASSSDLMEAFQTNDVQAVAERIVKHGEVLVTQEHRDEEKERKFKQIVDYFVTNAINPQNGNPYTAETIKNALNQIHLNLKNVPVENQAQEIIPELTRIIPVKIQTKRYELTIPAAYTGHAYGVVSPYKEHENWLDNGDLKIKVSIPAGAIMGFFDAINSKTHGSVLSEEIKE